MAWVVNPITTGTPFVVRRQHLLHSPNCERYHARHLESAGQLAELSDTKALAQTSNRKSGVLHQEQRDVRNSVREFRRSRTAGQTTKRVSNHHPYTAHRR